MNNFGQSKVQLFFFLSLGFIIALAVIYDWADDFYVRHLEQDIVDHNIDKRSLGHNEGKRAALSIILSQPFHYLGEGGQSYVFSSADQRYVLKLLKFKRLQPSWLVSHLPNISLLSNYRNKHIARKKQKLKSFFLGHTLAYDLHRQESGLILMQLYPSHVSQPVILIDKLGLQRKIDLENMVYVVQEKGETLRRVFSQLLNQGDLQAVKTRIGQVFDLYLSEYHKGIYDLDHGVMHNIGFVDDKPIHLDIGKFIYDERIKQLNEYQHDLIKVAGKIKVWIHKHYPQYDQELTEDIEGKLTGILGREFHFFPPL